MIAYCQSHPHSRRGVAEKPYTMDAMLLHISYEAGILGRITVVSTPTTKPNKGCSMLSVSPEGCARSPANMWNSTSVKGDCVACETGGSCRPGRRVLKALQQSLGGQSMGSDAWTLSRNRFVGRNPARESVRNARWHHPSCARATGRSESLTLVSGSLTCATPLNPQIRRARLTTASGSRPPGEAPSACRRSVTRARSSSPALVRLKLYRANCHHLRAEIEVLAVRSACGVDGRLSRAATTQKDATGFSPNQAAPAPAGPPGGAKAARDLTFPKCKISQVAVNSNTVREILPEPPRISPQSARKIRDGYPAVATERTGSGSSG